MTITKPQAWDIFRLEKLEGPLQIGGPADHLTKQEFEQYESFAEEFDLELAQIGIEAQNEAATIWGDNPKLVAELSALKGYDWTAEHYTKLVSLFKGSKFEKLHLSAQFRVSNNELLLELVKP